MWSHLVVVSPPLSDDFAGLRQRSEPMLVEAFVAELAVEALDVAVLRGAARFDQEVFDTVLLRPGDEDATGELGSVVRTNRAWITTEAGSLVEQTHHVGAADAMIHGDVHALASEVIDDGQALDAASIGQRITDKVHAPGVVGRTSGQQDLALANRSLGLPALAYLQLSLVVQAINLLVVHVRKLRAQQIM